MMLVIVLAVSLSVSACSLFPVRFGYICPNLPVSRLGTVPTVRVTDCGDEALVPRDLAERCIGDSQALALSSREQQIIDWGDDNEAIIDAHNERCERLK